MDLPVAFFRVRTLMDTSAVPDTCMAYVSTRSGLVQLGRENEETVGKFLPRSYMWNSRTGKQTEAESIKEREAFWAELAAAAPHECFVVKQEGTSRARGVHLFRGGEPVDARLKAKLGALGCIAQVYVANPCLLPPPGAVSGSGYKWDLRLYVLVVLENAPAGTGRPRALSTYQYCDAFARRCSTLYNPAGRDREGHVTNTAVNNKFGDREIIQYAMQVLQSLEENPDASTQAQSLPLPLGDMDDYVEAESRASQRDAALLKADPNATRLPVTMPVQRAWAALVEAGIYSAAAIQGAQAAMGDLVLNVLGAAFKDVREGRVRGGLAPHQYRRHVSLLGLDILFDHALHPYLLEINRFPDLTCYTMDQLLVKQSLVRDAVGCAFADVDTAPLFEPGRSLEDLFTDWERINPPVDVAPMDAGELHQDEAGAVLPSVEAVPQAAERVLEPVLAPVPPASLSRWSKIF